MKYWSFLIMAAAASIGFWLGQATSPAERVAEKITSNKAVTVAPPVESKSVTIAQPADLPPGWTIEFNEPMKLYRACTPNGYCLIAVRRSREEAIASAWDQIKFEQDEQRWRPVE